MNKKLMKTIGILLITPLALFVIGILCILIYAILPMPLIIVMIMLAMAIVGNMLILKSTE